MAAINQNDTFYANNKRTLLFTIMNKDVDPAAALVLTGLTLNWTLSRQNEDGSYSSVPVLVKSTSGGITIIDENAGKLSVELDSADTIKFSGKYHQQLEVVDGSAEGIVVATGTITILKNVNNS